MTPAVSDGFKTYTVENAGVGKDGTYILKVTTHSMQPDTDLEITAKNAVHAVLFKGIPAGSGFAATNPLAGSASAESTHNVYFNNFFLSDYRGYVKSVARNSVEIVKLKDKTFKTTAVVSVLKDKLRRNLEENGIISKL